MKSAKQKLAAVLRVTIQKLTLLLVVLSAGVLWAAPGLAQKADLLQFQADLLGSEHADSELDQPPLAHACVAASLH